MKRFGWRGINRPNAWFHHPRAFWSNINLPLGLRRQWYMAIHDPIYVGLWIALFIVIGASAVGVL